MSSRELAPNTCRGDGQEAATESVWRPIETAPRDGSVVLVIAAGGDFPMPAYWSEYDQRIEGAHDGCTFYPDPTHWMPLPEGPK